MKYPVHGTNLIDVTKAPYFVDNTGKTDCTDTLIRILDDVLSRQVVALHETYDKLVEMSNGMTEDVFLGLEGGRIEKGKVHICFPENEPSTKIIYFPKGEYLVSDTITYSLKNLKQYWYNVYPYFDNNRNIHLMGESKDNTVIRLMDNAPGFDGKEQKPLISFINNHPIENRDTELTNVAMMNSIEDLTLDCGKGNPSAVGIHFISSNGGRISNMNIRTESGKSGIYFSNSQGVYSDLKISGFDYGIDVYSTNMMIFDRIDLTGNKIAGVTTCDTTCIISDVWSDDIPTFAFRKGKGHGNGRYYFKDRRSTISGDTDGNDIFFDDESRLAMNFTLPTIPHSENAEDWALVDDFGAKGDGVTDSTRAIQRALNSGKPYIAFGEGRYLLDGKILIPPSVKRIDFMFCSLGAGSRLVGGEFDAPFEVREGSEDLLVLENISAWEQFKGHFRFVKQTAKRDILFQDFHLMSAALYFNTVGGSNIYLDNVFVTSGTYSQKCLNIPGKEFDTPYSRIIQTEFHNQKVYIRQYNPERADLAVLCDGGEMLLEGFRIEGPGSALKCIGGAKAKCCVFNCAIGLTNAKDPVFDIVDSDVEIAGLFSFSYNFKTTYNILIRDIQDGKEVTNIHFTDHQIDDKNIASVKSYQR